MLLHRIQTITASKNLLVNCGFNVNFSIAINAPKTDVGSHAKAAMYASLIESLML
jgi:hypothetical protein